MQLLYPLVLGGLVAALPHDVEQSEKRASLLAPSVQLSNAKVVGSALLGVDTFNGIPYAQPPVGNLRLRPPQPITSNLGTVNAVGLPKACPQIYTTFNSTPLNTDAITALLNSPALQAATDSGEDCLTLNVARPSTATSNSKLPVVFWIFGGGFEFGSTQTYNAQQFISTSILQGKPVIYVAVNYRLNGFGFLGGKEILADGASNLGLLDQRLGLQWVADNIAAFGGDPSKVTIWGESAGSISVFDQMALYGGDNTYNGKPLFRGGIMDSGSIVPADAIDSQKPQAVYDQVVRAAGCSGSVNTLTCLRGVSYQTLLDAVATVPGIFSYNSVALSFLPRPDGTVLTQSPEVIANNGGYAKVPFILGDQEDEGTLFSLTQANITTTAQLKTYFQTVFFPFTSPQIVSDLVDVYPDDITQGSPFNTGILNSIYPQFKRLAAMLGDLTFTLTRRGFLNIAVQKNPTVPFWSYLASYGYGTPVLGTFHASDIIPAYGIVPSFAQVSIQSYYLSFINTLNPNTG